MISIIIPIYNSKQFLKETIESVINQTIADWELILVDDGSTDSSQDICRQYQQQDSRIHLFVRENGGLSAARNLGLNQAKGDYVAFLDSDDLMVDDALEILKRAMLISEADISVGRIKKFKNSTPTKIKKPYGEFDTLQSFPPSKAVEKALYQRQIDNSVCGKLYKRQLWEKIWFREGIWFEDLDCFYHVFLKADKIAVVRDIVYLYRQHKDSFLGNFTLKRTDVLDVTQRLTEYMAANYPNLLPASRSRQLSANFNILKHILLNRGSHNDAISQADIYQIKQSCTTTIRSLRPDFFTNHKMPIKVRMGIMASLFLWLWR